MRENVYDHKPRPCFQGDDAYYLGVELEVEAPDSESKHKGLQLRKRPRGLYAKHDGSLNSHGWELVTHPIARNLWQSPLSKAGAAKRFFDLVGQLRELKYNSHDGGRCGLHIHVSRAAFGNHDCLYQQESTGCLRNEHFYWFARLLNDTLFQRISQRTKDSLDRWAQQRSVRRQGYLNGWGHHTAINITNHTVEVRIFRGNMREDRIRKAVEAVIAAVEWSRSMKRAAFDSPYTIELKEVDVNQEFLNYVKANRKIYKHLHAYLGEIGLLKIRGQVSKPVVQPEDGAVAQAPAVAAPEVVTVEPAQQISPEFAYASHILAQRQNIRQAQRTRSWEPVSVTPTVRPQEESGEVNAVAMAADTITNDQASVIHHLLNNL